MNGVLLCTRFIDVITDLGAHCVRAVFSIKIHGLLI